MVYDSISGRRVLKRESTFESWVLLLVVYQDKINFFACKRNCFVYNVAQYQERITNFIMQ